MSEETLQIAEKRRAAKSKGEKERHTHLNAEFQRIARSDKKAFLSDECKEIEENNRMGKTRNLFKKIGDTKGMSLLFNMLSRLVIIFLPRSKCFLISWLQSPSAVILEPRKIKSDTVSTVSTSICHEVMGPDAMIFVF